LTIKFKVTHIKYQLNLAITYCVLLYSMIMMK